MSKTTELRIKPTSFDDAMEKFCKRLEENVKPYVDKFNHMDSVMFRQDGGMKYIKVKSFQVNINTRIITMMEQRLKLSWVVIGVQFIVLWKNRRVIYSNLPVGKLLIRKV